MELAESMDESADDMTAADTAPRPKKEMYGGQRCWSTIGRIMSDSSLSFGGREPYVVWFQSESEHEKQIKTDNCKQSKFHSLLLRLLWNI